MVIPRRQHEFNRVPQSIYNSVQLCIQLTSGSPDCLIRRFSPSVGTFVNLNAGKIQTQVFHIRICGQCAKYGFQCAIVLPFGKSGIHRLPGAIRLRQFPPLCSATNNPKHPIVLLSIHTVSCLYFRTGSQFVQYLFFKQALIEIRKITAKF